MQEQKHVEESSGREVKKVTYLFHSLLTLFSDFILMEVLHDFPV